ncbi:MAG: hypothetical protein ACRCVI_03015 [Mycoplasmoidaceae bacterium]
MWWNLAIGGSMMVSSIGSLINVIAGITQQFINPGNSQTPSHYGSNYINKSSAFLRVSKYPSKSTLLFGLI